MTVSRSARAGGLALGAAALMLSSLQTSPATAATAARPSPGAPGVGDRLYPRLGNGGYDALHYSLRLRYRTALPRQAVDGTVTMRARATQALSRFDLDFSGDSVGAVTVDGRPARRWQRRGDLVIRPRHAIAAGATFSVTVRHFRATPTEASSDQLLSTAFFVTPDGSATSGQPNAMHSVYPSNDHPSDKASFSFRFDVPTGLTAVANGVRTGRHRHGARTVWTYRQRQPMATELTQLVVGRFTVIHRRPVGRIRVRDVVPTRLVPQYTRRLAVERSHLKWMQARVGGYPFDTYGSLVVDTHLGFALEDQTLSLYDTPWFRYPRADWSSVMLHELAHQWFGDSVAPQVWSDVWLNEGHATWYADGFAAQHHYLGVGGGPATVTRLMHLNYRYGDLFRTDFGPVGRPLSGRPEDVFNPNVYGGGELVLYALRQRVGAATFNRIERAWVQRYRGRSASTADFIALSSEVSGVDLSAFLRQWVYGTRTPPMPGHPGWSVAPPDDVGRLQHRLAAGRLALPRR